jgi:Inner membrane component of T3SS, cytoplasmic domain
MKTSPLLENEIAHTQESQLRSSEKHTLRVLSGLHTGASVELVNGSWLVVGSGSNCDVILNEDSVTQQHFLVGYQTGKVSVRVLDGFVCIKNRKLSCNETHSVECYDPIQVGSIHVAFGLDDAAKWAEVGNGLVVLESEESRENTDETESLSNDNAEEFRRENKENFKSSNKKNTSEETNWFKAVGKFAVASVLVVGVLVASWHGISLAKNALENKTTLTDTISKMGLKELKVVKSVSGNDLLIGVVPTEAKRAELIQSLAKAGISPASDIVTGEHLASAVQNEFRQRGFNVKANYTLDGTIAIDGVSPTPDLTALEIPILKAIKGVKNIVFVQEPAAAATAAIAEPKSVQSQVVSKTAADPKNDLKRITAVVGGEVGYIVTADGSRYSVGALMPDGTEIEKISDATVTFNRQGKSIVVDF